MTHSLMLPAVLFSGLVIFLYCRHAYWQERREGRSHEESSNESSVLKMFLIGSTVFDYVAVVAQYA